MAEVILVDEADNEIGTMEKMTAHEQAVLHRAFSVFLFNDANQLLLQKRALNKYHSPGLWTNTCCSHPCPGETTLDAAKRRLQEEMGVSCDLDAIFNFTYKAALDHDLTEFEFDHVFFGRFNGAPELNFEEAIDWKYVSINELLEEIESSPENYTVWFKICLEQVLAHIS
jgi:isopentenyl-diphosphate delta-isomerase